MIALDIADALTKAGARVFTARSLADALAAVEDEVPSAVILDHALSDGESSQLCKRLKERSIPYVLHSGYSNLIAPAGVPLQSVEAVPSSSEVEAGHRSARARALLQTGPSQRP